MYEVLERRFAAMGARLSVAERPWHGSPRIDVLRDWHRVLMNTEHDARAMRHVVFLD
jgi:hypothetical protein